MDFRRPVQSVIPGAQGRILAVLAETTADLNLRTIARLADVSPAQASRVLPQLVRLGLVERREAPPSALFRLVDDNIGSRLVRALSRSRDAVLTELRSQAEAITPSPVSLIVFGSFARGEADADSDLDVLLVHPDEVNDAEPSVEHWRQLARSLTGNRVEILESNETNARRQLRSRNALWHDIVRDSVVIYGKSLADLRGRASA
ncbi:MAG: nucleotidyltransferase domain-containing protein [Acidimicrobiales bacterium]